MPPLLPRPPPPRRAVGSRASRGAGKRGGGARGRAAEGPPGQSRSRRLLRRGAERERRSLSPGTGVEAPPSPGRPPLSMEPAARSRPGSLLLPPSLPEKARAPGSRHEETAAGNWRLLGSSAAAASHRPLQAVFGVAHAPLPRRTALRACAPGTVATGEGRRGRGLSLQAAGFRRGGAGWCPPSQRAGEPAFPGRCPRMERSKEVSPVFISLVVLPARTLNSLSASGA